MKVLFLDIDGVLNYSGTEARTPSGMVGIVDSLVKKLRTIIDNTNAIIVLSSDWKKLLYSYDHVEDLPPDGQYLLRKLKRRGLHISSKLSDDIPNRHRGEAIRQWLQHNGVQETDTWCVLDDRLFDDYVELGMEDHLVLTHEMFGLTDKDVTKAIDILNGYA